ncbi:3-deoxy-D-manno-octulosonic acid transferase [Mariprofundus sp. EBB-1]|uniref:3-deoxy-D-manno-octulosonic acid transferase n=1 Tax=Mariprofundus sp. EBB-1 TaxID=2650971 RepID=UPI001F4239BE|nr:3-deoxy-D-manno-octulosonic acid transferase [Mariprofundus sp. EBB-1]
MRDPSMKWRQQFTLDLPAPQPGCIWLHACSVGEVSSVFPLIKALIKQGHKVHLTVVTATGFSHAERLLQTELAANLISVAFLPWDLPTAMSRMISRLKPALLLLAETEFWPGMLAACRQQHIPVIGINTRISDRSFPRYRATSWLWKRWLAPVNLFLAQSDTDRNRLIALGIAASHVQVVGNLKYAISPPNVDATALRQQLDASGSRPILVIASTHEGEDARLLDMWPKWHTACPELLTVIVPRHPERFDQVAALIRQRGISLSRWSDPSSIAINNDVVLLDAMGLLTDLYTVADAVIIAGSLEHIGGHNPLEAAICGRGIVSGPHIQNFREIMADMQTAEAAIVCRDDHELEQAVSRLLMHPQELKSLHANAALFIEDRSHVLDRMLDAIKAYLPATKQATDTERTDV